MVYPAKCFATEMNINFVITNIWLLNHQWNAYLCIETYPFTFLRPKGRAEYFLIKGGNSGAKFTPHSLISYHMKEQKCKALKLDYCHHYVWQTSHQNNSFIHLQWPMYRSNVLPLVSLDTTSTCPSHATMSVAALGIVRKGNHFLSVHRKTILK